MFAPEKINLNDRQAMIDYLSNHKRYYTMNSWNGSTSYANNVKLYNILDDSIPKKLCEKAYSIVLNPDIDSFVFTQMIQDSMSEFRKQTGYAMGFNGRSDGYIVLYDVIDGDIRPGRNIDQFEDFNDWSLDDLQGRTKLVLAFDKACDDIRNDFIYMLEHSTIEEEEYTVVKTRKTLVID